jgi:hypothetical protein
MANTAIGLVSAITPPDADVIAKLLPRSVCPWLELQADILLIFVYVIHPGLIFVVTQHQSQSVFDAGQGYFCAYAGTDFDAFIAIVLKTDKYTKAGFLSRFVCILITKKAVNLACGISHPFGPFCMGLLDTVYVVRVFCKGCGAYAQKSEYCEKSHCLYHPE